MSDDLLTDDTVGRILEDMAIPGQQEPNEPEPVIKIFKEPEVEQPRNRPSLVVRAWRAIASRFGTRSRDQEELRYQQDIMRGGRRRTRP